VGIINTIKSPPYAKAGGGDYGWAISINTYAILEADYGSRQSDINPVPDSGRMAAPSENRDSPNHGKAQRTRRSAFSNAVLRRGGHNRRNARYARWHQGSLTTELRDCERGGDDKDRVDQNFKSAPLFFL